MKRTIRDWLPIVALICAIHAAWLVVGGLREFGGFPLDDAWIHQVFARSIARGQGFAFAGGVPSAGCSSPLWAILLAIPRLLGASPVVGAIVLGEASAIVAAICGGLFAEELARSLTDSPPPRWAARGSAVIVGLCSIWAWNAGSGMEGPAAAAALMGGLLLGVRERLVASSILIGVAIALRLETAVVLPLLAVDRVHRGKLVAARDLACALLLPVATLFYLRATAGSFLPQTLAAKVGDRALWIVVAREPLPEVVATLAERTLAGALAIVRVATLGALARGALLAIFVALLIRGPGSRRGWLLPIGLLVLQPIAMELLPQPGSAIDHEGRYVVQLVALSASVSAAAACALVSIDRSGARLAGVLLAVLVISELYSGTRAALRARANRREIQHLQVELANWVRARSAAGTTIAARDVGAIGYFADPARIVDLMGLVSPHILEARRANRPYKRDASVRFVEVFAGEFPDIVAGCTEVARAHEPLATHGGRQTMIIYECAP